MDAALVGQIIGGLIGGLFFGLIIWLVAKLNLGIEVDNYWWAVTAGFVISALSNFAATVVPDMSGIIGAIVSLVVAAIVILVSDKILKGMRVNGFTGAIVAAIAIGVVQFIIVFGLTFVGQAA